MWIDWWYLTFKTFFHPKTMVLFYQNFPNVHLKTLLCYMNLFFLHFIHLWMHLLDSQRQRFCTYILYIAQVNQDVIFCWKSAVSCRNIHSLTHLWVLVCFSKLMSLKYCLKHQFMAADDGFYSTCLQPFPLNSFEEEKILIYMIMSLILSTLKAPTTRQR